MKEYKIYLSGGIMKFGTENFQEGNIWRYQCKNILENYECDYKVKTINPNSYFNFVDNPPKYSSQNEVMRFDLYKLRNSDLVIANFNDKQSLGTMAELAIAYDRGIPIIGLNTNKQDLHPWSVCFCERIFTDTYEMFDYIKDFYLR